MNSARTTARPTLWTILLIVLVAAPWSTPVKLVLAHNQSRTDAAVGKRVGLQVGHLRIDELPEDQARLRTQTGGSGGGYREVDINLAVVERTAALLSARGVTVDILPATVPRGYRADIFLAVHCDAVSDPGAHGFKLARYRASLIPDWDDRLVSILTDTYGAATGLPYDDNITRGMTGYYAYNARLYRSTIHRQTPAAIVELGFLTNTSDRVLLVNHQDRLAAALADGILRFLTTMPLPAIPDGPAERRGSG